MKHLIRPALIASAALLAAPVAMAQVASSQRAEDHIPAATERQNPPTASSGPVAFNAHAPAASVAGYAGLGTGAELLVMHDLGIETPRGSPVAGVNHYGSSHHYIMDQPGVQDFAERSEYDSYTTSNALGGNTGRYGYAEAHPGSGPLWAQNWVLQLDPGSSGSDFVSEMDINNLTGTDDKEFGAVNHVDLLLNGLGNVNTAAISCRLDLRPPQTGRASVGTAQ